jgi:hypothetical protein
MVIIQKNRGTIFHYMQSINVFAPFIVISPQGVASNNFILNMLLQDLDLGRTPTLVELTTKPSKEKRHPEVNTIIFKATYVLIYFYGKNSCT